MTLPNQQQIRAAQTLIYKSMPPTPQYRWPLLCERLGTEVILKHENHTPVGAFKVRGGLVYFEEMKEQLANGPGVIGATRGNHGQSLAMAAGKFGIPVTIVVPQGNSVEKNQAMQGLGATMIEYGEDFQAALDHAVELSVERGLKMIPSFDFRLVQGVATYSVELFEAFPNLDAVYVPIGLGSGICGAVAAKLALGLSTEIIGVTSTHAPAFATSLEKGEVVERPATTQLADGVACRKPQVAAFDIIKEHVDRIVEVSDEEVGQAMRDIFECTHNVAEGAGAAGVAAIRKDADDCKGKQVATVLCGGNVDTDVFARVLKKEL